MDFLKPNWFSFRLLISMYEYSCSWTSPSRILPGSGKSYIGRRSLAEFGCVVFGIGMTVATFQSSGKEPTSTERLNRWVNSL